LLRKSAIESTSLVNNVISVKLILCILFPAEQSKLENVKMMGARDKINAISLNIKINKRKSVHIRGHKLPINVQDSRQKDSALAKISLKVVGGLLFLTHSVHKTIISAAD